MKTKKTLKSKDGYAQKYRRTVRGIRGVCPEEKGRLRWERFARREGFKPGMKGEGRLMMRMVRDESATNILTVHTYMYSHISIYINRITKHNKPVIY